MLRSMTGFASDKINTDCLSAVWEIRSVNHRYLEVSCRLPETFRHLEMAAKELVRQTLQRGKVECSLRYEFSTGEQHLPQILNPTLCQELANNCAHVSQFFNATAPINPLDILRWPGVLQNDDNRLLQATDAILDSLRLALGKLQDARRQEGAQLATCLTEKLQQITEQVQNVREHLPNLQHDLGQRLQRRLADLTKANTQPTQLEPSRLEQEIVLLLQKADVVEELDRLDSHLLQVANIIAKGGTVGRRLDFFMQEFNREANTLGSKAADQLTSEASVALKVLIEQMREQIQNIE